MSVFGVGDATWSDPKREWLLERMPGSRQRALSKCSTADLAKVLKPEDSL